MGIHSRDFAEMRVNDVLTQIEITNDTQFEWRRSEEGESPSEAEVSGTVVGSCSAREVAVGVDRVTVDGKDVSEAVLNAGVFRPNPTRFAVGGVSCVDIKNNLMNSPYLAKTYRVDPDDVVLGPDGSWISGGCTDSDELTKAKRKKLSGKLFDAVNSHDAYWNPIMGSIEHYLCLGADPTIGTRRHNQTALMVAARKGDVDLVRTLLKYGANVNAVAGLRMDETVLTIAAKSGRTRLVEVLVLEYGADIRFRDSYALEIAIQNGHEEMAAFLRRALDSESD